MTLAVQRVPQLLWGTTSVLLDCYFHFCVKTSKFEQAGHDRYSRARYKSRGGNKQYAVTCIGEDVRSTPATTISCVPGRRHEETTEVHSAQQRQSDRYKTHIVVGAMTIVIEFIMRTLSLKSHAIERWMPKGKLSSCFKTDI